MTSSIPDKLRVRLEACVAEGRYDKVSGYLRDLVRAMAMLGAGNAAAGLIAEALGLMVGRGAGEEDGGGVLGRAGRTDRDLSLVLLGRVLNQREAELADTEGERLVVIADDEGDVG